MTAHVLRTAQRRVVRVSVDGQRMYFAACDPQRRVDVVVDNRDVDAPRVVRG